MGGLCEPTTKDTSSATTTVSGSTMPAWVSKGGKELFGQASTLAKRPYETYTGPRVAGFSADELAGQEMTRGNVGAFSPYMKAAMPLLERGGEQWSSEVADRYMNPYQKQVLDISRDEMIKQADISKMGRAGRAVQAGAFGGAREGVIESEAQSNLIEGIGDMYSRGMGAGYESARTAFGADRGAALGAASQYGQTGQLAQQLGYTDADIMMRSGEGQRGLEQRGLDVARGDFEAQQRYPYEQINFATGVLQGVPYNRNTTTTTTGTQPVQGGSALGQVAGLGMAGAALGSNMGWWG